MSRSGTVPVKGLVGGDTYTEWRINQLKYGNDLITYDTLSRTGLSLRRRADGYGPLGRHRDSWLVSACAEFNSVYFSK